MRALALSLLMIAVLPAGRHAMAADSAASLIEAVSRAASDTNTWEAEGRLVTQESSDNGTLRTEASFRIVMERVPAQRARIEITGVPAPLIRVCDSSLQWGHLPATKQYWSLDDTRIDACAEPFNEWPYLGADLHEPEITGRERLHNGEKVVDCIVVRGDYAGPDASRSGKRTIWINKATNRIWQYRVERGTTSLASHEEPAVRVYTLVRQTTNGDARPGDFAVHHPDDWAMLPRVPPMRLGDGAPLSPKDNADLPSVFEVGAGVSAPIVLSKDDPAYTAEARHKHIEGTVVLYLEVGPDGAAHNVRVMHSVDPGLDQNAIKAVSQWKFRPGRKDRVPVTVAATIEVNFRLNDKKKR